MKQLGLKGISLTLALTLAPSLAFTGTSGSMSKSCSGQMKVCENGSCSNQYFYIYAYQYAYIQNREVQSESHSFSFSGALGDINDYKMSRYASKNHVLYIGPKFSLAIPWDGSQGIYAAQGIGGPGEDSWQLLCK